MAITKYESPAIASSGAANTKGSYVQITAATAEAAVALAVVVALIDGSVRSMTFDLATGAAASEVIVLADVAASNANQAALNRPSFTMPVAVAASTRLAARVQCSTGATNGYLIVYGLGGTMVASPVTSTQTLGAISGSLPPTIDPGGTPNTYGAYTALTSSLATDGNWCVAIINGRRNAFWVTNATFVCDLAIGAAGSEVVATRLEFMSNNTSDTDRWEPLAHTFPWSVSAGSRVAARAQSTTADATDRLFGLQLIVGVAPTSGFVINGPSNTTLLTSARTTVTASTTPNVKGAYTALFASTAQRAQGMSVNVAEALDDNSFLLDLATGAAGSEALIFKDFSWVGSHPSMHIPSFFYPLGIAPGTRVAARLQADNPGGSWAVMVLRLVPGSNTTTLAESTAVVAVDPGVTPNTKGSYVQVHAALVAPANWTVVGLGGGSLFLGSDFIWYVDLAVGAAGSEVIVAPDLYARAAIIFGGQFHPNTYTIPLALAAGSRVAARAQCNGTDFDRFVRVQVIGVEALITAPGCAAGGEITVVADPANGETFAGRSISPRAWLTIGFDDTDRSMALDSYNHVSTYYGGRKVGALLSSLSITRRLSDRFSSYKMADVSVEVDDDSRILSTLESLAASEHWANREARIHLASPTTIAAGGTAHTLFRGIWRGHLSHGFTRTLGFTDILGSEFSDFNLEQQIPKRLCKDIFDNAIGISLEANTTDPALLGPIRTANALAKANLELPQPIAYGKISDKQIGTITTTIPPVQVSLATVVAQLQASVTAGTCVADWGAIIGYQDAATLQAMGTVPNTYTALANVIGYSDLDYLLQQQTGGGVIVSQYDLGHGKIAPRYVGYYMNADGVIRHAFLVAGHAIQHIEGQYIDGNAFSADEPDYHAYESADWATVSGTSNKYMTIGGQRVTMVFMNQGARADAIISGQALLTLNICGIEDVGDGTGNVITEAPRIAYHLLEQWVLQNYTTGAWAAASTSDDGIPWLNTASFDALEAIEIQRIGGRGYQGAVYLDQQTALRDLLGEMLENWDMGFGPNQHGQVIASHLDEFVVLSSTTYLKDVRELVRPTDIDRRLGELENKVLYDWDYRPADGTFGTVDATVSDAAAITANRGREAIAEKRQYTFVMHQQTAEDVAWRALQRAKYPPRYVNVVCSLHALSVTLGSIIRVDDVDGIGATGWTARPLRVIGIRVDLGTLIEDPTVTLECLDVQTFLDQAFLARLDTLSINATEVASIVATGPVGIVATDSLRIADSEAASIVPTTP